MSESAGRGHGGGAEPGRTIHLGRVSLPGGRAGRTRLRGQATRAVARMRYTPLRTGRGQVAQGAIERVKASARYYAYRPDADGHRVYRAGFDGEEDALGQREVARWIEREGSRWAYSYRMVLSPGEAMDQNEIRAWTRGVLGRLGFAPDQYVSFAHAGHDRHTEHDHVHVLCFTAHTLTRGQFQLAREVGDQLADDGLRRALTQELAEVNARLLRREREAEPGVRLVRQRAVELEV